MPSTFYRNPNRRSRGLAIAIPDLRTRRTLIAVSLIYQRLMFTHCACDKLKLLSLVAAAGFQRANQRRGFHSNPTPLSHPRGWTSLVGAARGGRARWTRAPPLAVSASFRAANHRRDAGRARALSRVTVARGPSPDPDIGSGSGGQVSGRQPAGSCRPLGTGDET